jgi:hypothetical protein
MQNPASPLPVITPMQSLLSEKHGKTTRQLHLAAKA